MRNYFILLFRQVVHRVKAAEVILSLKRNIGEFYVPKIIKIWRNKEHI